MLGLKGRLATPAASGSSFFSIMPGRMVSRLCVADAGGLIPDFRDLFLDSAGIEAPIQDFYERTSEYELDAWSEWRGIFKPFGTALAVLFSRRLQQLNVPLSALDTSHGITSEVVQLQHPESGKILQTAWIREMVGTKNVLYAGGYAVCTVPGHPSPCVKVVFHCQTAARLSS